LEMKKSPVGNAVRFMLAAWTLLATALVSPPMVHCHSGGNNPHVHDRTESIPRPQLPSDVPEPYAGGQKDEMSLFASDLHQHGYFWLLGTVRYFPPPGGPIDPRDKAPGDWEKSVVAVLTPSVLRTCSSGTLAGHFDLASLAEIAVDGLFVSEHREFPSPGAFPGSPLCDRARHALSGVLLT
jgi:hypothetical protein